MIDTTNELVRDINESVTGQTSHAKTVNELVREIRDAVDGVVNEDQIREIVAGIIGSAPEALDTLGEIADALSEIYTKAEVDTLLSGVDATVLAEVQNARVGSDNVQYSTLKARLDAENADLKNAIENVSGLSDDAKLAFLNCFQNVAWINGNGQEYYDALQDALYSSVASIIATFTQGSRVFYTSDSLNDLKPYLVVQAVMSDGSTNIVTAYNLSGTLTVGTSFITVSYGGKTATFNVTGVELPTAIYTLFNKPFNGSSDYVDTGIQLLKTDSAFTIFVDFTSGNYIHESAILHCVNESNPYPGYFLGERTNVDENRYFRHSYYSHGWPTYFSSYDTNKHRYAIVHKAGEKGIAKWYFDSDIGSTYFGDKDPYVNVNQRLLIGCYQDVNGNLGRYWNGMIHKCQVWDLALNDNDIAYLMGGAS